MDRPERDSFELEKGELMMKLPTFYKIVATVALTCTAFLGGVSAAGSWKGRVDDHLSQTDKRIDRLESKIDQLTDAVNRSNQTR